MSSAYIAVCDVKYAFSYDYLQCPTLFKVYQRFLSADTWMDMYEVAITEEIEEEIARTKHNYKVPHI